MNTTKMSVVGLAPLIVHNGRLADPLDEWAQALSALTAKRKKTIDDHKEISRVEWYGGLYVDENKRPCLPGEFIEGALLSGGKKSKQGQDVKAGIIVAGNFLIKHDGPTDLDELWACGKYLQRKGVRVGPSRVIRTRPFFPVWSCDFIIEWDPHVIKSERALRDIVSASGQCGWGEWRPKFGRCELI